MKDKKEPRPDAEAEANLRESYEKAVGERDKAEAEIEEMSKEIEGLKKKLGTVENALGGLVSNLQHEVDVREAKIHKLEDEVEVVHHDVEPSEGGKFPVKRRGNDEVSNALSQVEWGTQQKKSYSPDRSFEDLLTESRKRKEQWDTAHQGGTEWEQEEVDEVRSSSGMKWLLALGGVAVVGAGIASVMLWLSNESAAGTDHANEAGMSSKGDQMEEAIEKKLKEELRRSEEISEFFKAFLATESLKDKAEMCLHPKRALLHMTEYHERYENIPRDFEELKLDKDKVALGSGREAWKVTIKHDGEREPRVAFVFEANDGKYLIDWESYARFQKKPWEEFLNTHSVEPQTMHLLVGTGADEHPDYPAEKYYGVRVRGWEEDAYRWSLAFIPKDNPKAQAFIGKMNKVPDNVDAHGLPYRFEHYILKVRHSDNEEDPLHTLIIEDIVSEDFIYPEDLAE